jgi:hypothetical protein
MLYFLNPKQQTLIHGLLKNRACGSDSITLKIRLTVNKEMKRNMKDVFAAKFELWHPAELFQYFGSLQQLWKRDHRARRTRERARTHTQNKQSQIDRRE